MRSICPKTAGADSYKNAKFDVIDFGNMICVAIRMRFTATQCRLIQDSYCWFSLQWCHQLTKLIWCKFVPESHTHLQIIAHSIRTRMPHSNLLTRMHHNKLAKLIRKIQERSQNVRSCCVHEKPTALFFSLDAMRNGVTCRLFGGTQLHQNKFHNFHFSRPSTGRQFNFLLLQKIRLLKDNVIANGLYKKRI